MCFAAGHDQHRLPNVANAHPLAATLSNTLIYSMIKMDWNSLIKTFILCFISIIIEAISATKEGKQWFEQLKRPKYSFSLPVWYIVGGIYYIIFGIVAYRLFSVNSNLFSLPIILLIFILLLNGFGNFIVFKYKSLKWFYLIIYPYAILLSWFIILLIDIDKLSAALATIYLLWLIYDLYYGYNIWKLNDKTN